MEQTQSLLYGIHSYNNFPHSEDQDKKEPAAAVKSRATSGETVKSIHGPTRSRVINRNHTWDIPVAKVAKVTTKQFPMPSFGRGITSSKKQ